MQRERQHFTEVENKNITGEVPNQTFTIQLPNLKRNLLAVLVFSAWIILNIIGLAAYPQYQNIFFVSFGLMAIALVLSLGIFRNYLFDVKTAELYEEKLVIREKEIVTIPFTEIQKYVINRQNVGTTVLKIRLRNGRVIRFNSDSSRIDSFVDAFDKVMQHLISDKQMDIERKIPNWQIILNRVLLVTVLLAFIWKLFKK